MQLKREKERAVKGQFASRLGHCSGRQHDPAADACRLVVRFRSSSAARGTFGYETSESKDHWQLYDSSAPLEHEVRDRICRTVCADFGFGAPVFKINSVA